MMATSLRLGSLHTSIQQLSGALMLKESGNRTVIMLGFLYVRSVKVHIQPYYDFCIFFSDQLDFFTCFDLQGKNPHFKNQRLSIILSTTYLLEFFFTHLYEIWCASLSFFLNGYNTAGLIFDDPKAPISPTPLPPVQL